MVAHAQNLGLGADEGEVAVAGFGSGYICCLAGCVGLRGSKNLSPWSLGELVCSGIRAVARSPCPAPNAPQTDLQEVGASEAKCGTI